MKQQFTTAERILATKIRLQKEQPFFAWLILHMNIQHDEARSMCGIDKDGNPAGTCSIDHHGNLYYSKKFIDSLSDNQIKGLLCVTGETFINGENPSDINVLKKGKKVYDGQNKLTEVKKVFKRNYNGDIYKIYGRNLIPIEITPDHPIWIARPYIRSNIKRENRGLLEQSHGIRYMWIKPKYMQKGDFLIIPRIKTCTFIKELYIKHFRKQFKNEKRKENTIPLNEEIAFLMGLYVADGSCNTGIKKLVNGKISKNISAIQINLNNKKKEDVSVADYIQKIVKKNLNLNTKRYIYASTLTVMLGYGPLARAFSEWFGKGAKNKKIPSFILHNKKSVIKSFLAGLIAGDGCYYKKRNRIQIATVSRQLAFQLQLLYSRIGILPHLYAYRREGHYHTIGRSKLYDLYIYQLGYHPKQKKKSYIVKRDHILTKVRKIEKSVFKGDVFNIETISHTYTTNNIVVHNCHEILHIALNHLIRRGKRKPQLFNIANDIWVNDNLITNNIELPPNGILPHNHEFKFEDLNVIIKDIDQKSSEQIYDELPKIKFKKGNKFIAVAGNSKNKEIEGGFDHHIYAEVSKEEQEKIEKKWRAEIVSASIYSKLRGKLPKGMDRLIDRLLDSKIGWRHKLYKYISNSIKNNYTFSRPNRKSFSLGCYLPDMLKENMELIATIDSSGSISQENLTSFMSELITICRSFDQIKARVIVCDASIHSDDEITNGNIDKLLDLKIKGFGGTSHSEIVKKINEQYPNTKLLVIFSDGFSDLQEEIPKLPYSCKCVIVLTPQSEDPKKFEHLGEVIKLEE